MPPENDQQDQQQQQQQSQGGTQPTGDPGKYNPSDLEEARKIIASLEKRVGEREAALTDLGNRLSTIEQQRRQQLEQEGNWAELAKQRQAELEALKPYQERAQTLEAVIRQSNDARLSRIPESVRDMVPIDYAPEKLQDWLNRNEARLTNPPPPRYDAGAGGTPPQGGVSVTDADRRAAEVARNAGHNITAEDIAKRRLEQQKK